MKVTKRGEGWVYLVLAVWALVYCAAAPDLGLPIILESVDPMFLIALGLLALWRVSRW